METTKSNIKNKILNMWKFQNFYFLFFIFNIALIGGCTSMDDYSSDVSSSRQSAYNQWQHRKEQQEKAQVIISGELSLQDCIKLTLVNNKTLQSVIQDKEIARGQEVSSYSGMLPTVALSFNYSRQDKVQSIGPFTLGDFDNYAATLRVTQPIYAGGAIVAGVNSTRLFRLITDQTVRATTQDVMYSAERAYYDVMLNQHLLEISNDAVKNSKAHLENVSQRKKQGVASDYDVLRAEVELSNFQAEYIRNKNAVDISKNNLLKIMGVSQDSDFKVIAEFIYEPSDMSLDSAVQLAFNNRPDIFSKEFSIKYQNELLKISKSKYYPVIGGFFEASEAKPDPHNPMLIDWGSIWTAGASITLNAFDGLNREGSVIAQKARVRQSEIDLINSEETALFEINSAILGIQNAAEFVDSQKLNLTRASEGLRLVEVGYREGTNTQLEMLDAQSALTQARVNYYQSIYSHNVAKLILLKAMGTIAVPVKENK
jgi:outer membrane protein